MASINAYAHQIPGFSFGRIAHTIVAAFKSARASSAAYSRVYKELSQLTDRELSDIGISRSMIREIAQSEADRF